MNGHSMVQHLCAVLLVAVICGRTVAQEPVVGGGEEEAAYDDGLSPAQAVEVSQAIEAYEAQFGGVASAAGGVAPAKLKIVPMGATLGEDVWVNNYVDLNPSSDILDWHCTRYTYDGHNASDNDIRSFGEQRIGVPVFAAADGTVIYVVDDNFDENAGCGGPCPTPSNIIRIEHAGGRRTYYHHLKQFSALVNVGDTVVAGQQIASVGSSGNSSAPHLHFAVYDDYGTTLVEPYAGACRAGESEWLNQPAFTGDPALNDFGITYEDRSTWPDPPEPLPRSGQFAITDGSISYWFLMRNLPQYSTWQTQFQRPDGTIAYDSGVQPFYNVSPRRSSWYWHSWDIPDMHSITGTWHILVDINGQRMVTAPIEVRTARTADFNHAPEPIGLVFDPPNPTPDDVPFCRVQNDPVLEDYDYDIVRYHYVWEVDDGVVRDVVSAGRADAIPHYVAPPGATLRCTVTPSDGKADGPTTSISVVVGGCTTGGTVDCNGNGLDDRCELLDGTAQDCNGDASPDECDLAVGASADCNANDIPDECDTASGFSGDCNNNMVPDDCEVAVGTAPDCNNNDIPDVCDTQSGFSEDCNNNHVPDDCEVAAGTVPDCNNNLIPDLCDIASGFSENCNGNGVPDECEADCNGSGRPDICDVIDGASQDCNSNYVPDECEPDCNGNNVPDACDISSGSSADCNANAVPDECELAGGSATDCNANGVLDECDLSMGTSTDCNANGVLDECDLAQPGAQDCQANGVLDECELQGIAHRYAFNTDASDDVGGISGQLQPGATVAGGALMLDGTGGVCTINAPEASAGRKTLTIEAWATWAGGGDVQRLVELHWPDSQYTMYVSPSVFGSAAMFLINNNTQQQQFVQLGSAFTVGAETHIAVALDPAGDEVRVYRDGLPVATLAPAGIVGLDLWTQATTWLGGADVGAVFVGSVDELRIYDRALTDEQMAWSYAVSTNASVFAGNDCDNNEVPDDCESDCNQNGVNDTCDLIAGQSVDLDESGTLDECECAPPAPPATGAAAPGNRYLSFGGANPGKLTAIRVRMPDGSTLWVGPPSEYPEEDSSDLTRTFVAAPLQCDPYFRDWGTQDLVHVFGAEITPNTTFDLQAVRDCAVMPPAETLFSSPLIVTTAHWGDVAPPYYGDDPGVAQPDFTDIASLVSKFLAEPTAPIKAQSQLQPNIALPARPVDFNDISSDVDAFLGTAFGDMDFVDGPCTCPSTVTCGVTACASDTQCAGGGFCIDGYCTDACGRCSP